MTDRNPIGRLLTPKDVTFLRGLASAAIASATIAPGETVTEDEGQPGDDVAFRPSRLSNTLGFSAVRPGGRACYPAIWTQDFTMTCASGLVDRDMAHAHLRLIAACQNNARSRILLNQAVIPPFAVPDHINFDGSAVFFPGTYSSGDDQGGEPWGLRPPLNNAFDFIWLAWMLCREGGTDLLTESIAGVPLIQRLQSAFDAIPVDPETNLVFTSESERAVDLIFRDSAFITGQLLWPSMQRYRAAGHLNDLYAILGDAAACGRLNRIRRKIGESLPVVLCPRPGRGWLRASTDISPQEDVWGTLYALHANLLPEFLAVTARRQVMRAIEDGTILYEAAVRHVPTDGDASPASMWEKCGSPHNRYQNGAYWHMPTGWLISALWPISPAAARSVWSDFVAHMRTHDFRIDSSHGGPWECIGPMSEQWQNDTFLPSITMPLAVLTTDTANS